MEETKPKTFVFVLMPFSDDFMDIYEVGIKAACRDAGAYCERVDEQKFDESILERVYNQIAKGDVIVADMTGRNPNVFYETGYAHALNKRVILLTQNADDIPFDLKHYPHIIYGGRIAGLKSQLESRILWCIENPKESLSNVDITLDVLVNGVAVTASNEISVIFYRPEDSMTKIAATLRIDIHNPTNKLIKPESFNLSILMPKPFNTNLEGKHVRRITELPDGKAIYSIRLVDSLFPDGWTSTEIELRLDEYKHEENLPSEIILRLFTELGPKDYPFILKKTGA